MITKADILKRYANEWRSLAAWGAPISMQLEIRPSKYCDPATLGRANSWRGTAWAYDTGDLVCNLKTVLHELAHLAAPDSVRHAKRWRELYVRAASEALGASVDDFDLDVELLALNQQVERAVRDWLDRSGQTVVLRAIGVI